MATMEQVKLMKEKAEADPQYTLKCIKGEKVFFVEGDKALLPGHCYSEAGRDEYAISRCCEFHFDEMFGDEDD